MKRLQNAVLAVALLAAPIPALAQDVYDPPQAEKDWAMQFDGTSGPGRPVEGYGLGGWRSGTDGVRYQGAHPKPEYSLDFRGMATGSAVAEGLVPPIVPALELHIRDGVVTLGGDGNYYLTGSTGDNIWARTDGVELWRSPNLKDWEYLGLVWNIDEEADEWVRQWRKHPRRAVRAVWAPEIHYVKGNYYICFSMCPGGIGLLRSTTGKPEGPYVNAFKGEAKPIVDAIDPTLFEDADGSVYFTYGDASKIVKLTDSLDGFDGEPFAVALSEPDTVKAHHATKCGRRGGTDIGHEGAVLFRRGGLYYLGAADSYEGRYSTCLAVSENLRGPYRLRHESVPCGGGTGFFKDKEGKWWTSYFGNDSQSHFREKVGFVRVEFSSDGRAYPAREQPFVPEEKRAEWEARWDKVWKGRHGR